MMADTQPDAPHPLTQALVDAHAATLGAAQEASTARLVGLLEQFETDMAPLLAPLLAHVVDHPDTPEPLRNLLRAATDPHHFGESVVIGIALGSILSPALGAAFAPFVQGLANTVWPLHTNVPLSPEQAAVARLKGVIGQQTQYDISSLSGVSPTHAERLYDSAGQAPGIMEGLLLLRRGDIDLTEFQRIVHYSDIRSDFLDDLLKLQYLPPTVGEFVAGRLKGHLDDQQYHDGLTHAGINPALNADWLLATAGRPPGIEQMLHLWNRHESGDPTSSVTEADVDAAVRQSDVNDHYLGAVKALRWYLPPVRSIMAMLRAGAIDDTKATQLFTEQGVRPADIPGYLSEAHHSRTTTMKEPAQALVVRMYEAQFIPRAEAVTKLETLRYDTATANLILDFADQARDEALMNAVIRKTATLYVAHKITLAEAATAMNGAGVPSLAQHQLVKYWDLERAANVRLPSETQVVGAYRRGEISAAACKRRLLAMGVQQDDLGIFVADGYPPNRQDPVAVAAVVNA